MRDYHNPIHQHVEALRYFLRNERSLGVYGSESDLARTRSAIRYFADQGAEHELDRACNRIVELEERCASLRANLERVDAAQAKQRLIAQALLRLLWNFTEWEPTKPTYESRSPAHGHCCTCQDCGRDHGDCVCEHNDITEAIAELGISEAEVREMLPHA